MKKKKILSIVSLLCVAVMCIFCGCVSQEKEKGPQFLEGALTETELGVDILISELVELDDSVDYEFTITDPSNKEKDYSSRKIWIPEDIGKHTLTYSILEGKNKGVATHTVEVVGRAIEWSFDNTSPYIYQKGTTLEFADLFDDMNVLVQSDYPYTLSMMSVLVDGVRTDLTGKTSYTLDALSEHIFRFRVDTEDGQYSVATVAVGVRYMEDEVAQWFETNNMTAHNYLTLLNDKSVLFAESIFTGIASKVRKTDLANVTYNGEYGVGDYVMFDFTGSNLPQLCFFADTPTANLVDGKNGVYIANGFGTNAAPSETKRMTFYGPWKIKGAQFGGSDRLRVETSSPIGSENLDKNARYRYIAGVSNVSVDTYTVKKDDANVTYTGNVATLRLLLLNLDTGEAVYDKEVVLTSMAMYDLPEEYFKGNIVAYGEIDSKTTWTKMYPVQRNVTDIYSLVQQGTVVKNYPNTVPENIQLSASDYFEIDQTKEYSLYYTDASGAKTNITGETFSFTETGEYRLFYEVLDGETIPVSVKLTVTDMSASTWEFLQTNDIRLYKSAMADDGSVTVEAGTYAGKPNNVSMTEIPYVSFDGEYGVGDYVTVDFTGSNLPQLSFFVNDTTPNLVDGKNGVYLANGFGENDAPSERSRMTIYGPWKIKGAQLGGTNRLKTEVNSPFGALFLDENTRYRYIAGVSKVEAGEVDLHLLLINLDTQMFLYDTVYALDMTSYGLTEEYFTGNIVAQGTLNTPLVWDEIYPITKNATSIYEVASFESFKENAPTFVVAGATLNVSDYIDVPSVPYELYYLSATGERTNVTGNTFSFAQAGTYTLYYRLVNGKSYFTTLNVSVLSETAYTFLNTNVKDSYKAKYTANGEGVGVELAEGSYEGNNAENTGATDVPYVEFNGSYGRDNYLTIDFTGNNMPNISFFYEAQSDADKKNMVGGKGIFLTQGVLGKDGKMHSTIAGRYMLHAFRNFSGTVWGAKIPIVNTDNQDAKALTYAEMSKAENANKEYRLVVGFHADADSGTVKYSVILMQKNGAGAEYEYSILTKIVAQQRSIAGADSFDFNGSIMIYGRPYQTTKLDGLHAVYTGSLKTLISGWTGTNIW